MVSDDEVVRRALEAAKDIKAAGVRREGPGADPAPMLDLRLEGLSLGVAIVDGERDRMLSLLRTLVALSAADLAVFITDAYGLTSPADAGWPELEVGELGRRHAAGDPTVYECLNVVSVARDGTAGALKVQYHYEGRSLVWHDDLDVGIEGGDVLARLRQGFMAQSVRPMPAMNATDLAEALGVVVATPALVAPPRNEPCPCGSGVKAKKCCWS